MLLSSDFFLKTKLKKSNQFFISFLNNYKLYTPTFYVLFTYNRYISIFFKQSLQYVYKLLFFTNLYSTNTRPFNKNYTLYNFFLKKL